MTAALILRIALPTPLRRLFDYLPPIDAQSIDFKSLKRGVRIQVPFQSRTLVGILIEVSDQSTVPYGKLKPALAILDDTPVINDDVYKLCLWAAEYYHYSLGEVLLNALPTIIRQGKPASVKPAKNKPDQHLSAQRLTLNVGQSAAVDTISQSLSSFKTFLLDGVTGSGKTEVYLCVIEELIKQNKQVLVLVPEISLTPQTVARFRQRFQCDVAVMHSGLNDKERLRAWLQASSGAASIVIGTRSAIFTPFANLGLIIVDEEHDTSFKQQDRFRYHARDLAIMRGNHMQIPIVLGSATPSLESLLNVKRKRYHYINLPERAGNAAMPQFEIVDLRVNHQDEGLSHSLMQTIKKHLAANNQVMLFLNRRGYAPVLYCSECAWIAECKRCDARMVYHHKPIRLKCHHCDAQKSIPTHCEQCQKNTLQPIGLGTQRLEQVLKTAFTDVPIIRLDRDNTRKKNALNELLEQVHATPKAILLGTQMLAKGHHFPNVTLVGIIDADSGLFSADFRAAEQMGQLLIQVAGRAGRADKPGTVVIQTRHPNHTLLQTLIQQGYSAFSQAILLEREAAEMPPFAYFAVFRAESFAEKTATQFLSTVKRLGESLTDAVSVLGPVPALMAKRKGLFCQQLLIRAERRSSLQNFLKGLMVQIEKIPGSSPVKWALDVDPMEVI